MQASPDDRTPERRFRDEQIASEPALPALDLPSGSVASPVERHLPRRTTHPIAVLGVVENGLVRPLDPTVKLVEDSQVIIVAAKG
jgi:hypothetical protein